MITREIFEKISYAKDSHARFAEKRGALMISRYASLLHKYITLVIVILFSSPLLGWWFSSEPMIDEKSAREPKDGTERVFGVYDKDRLVTYKFQNPMRAKNGPNCGAYLRFYNMDYNRWVADIYIKSGTDSVPLTLPLGSYKVDYTLGEKWYGYDRCFGKDGLYYTFNGIMEARLKELHMKWTENRARGKWRLMDKSKFWSVQRELPVPSIVLEK